MDRKPRHAGLGVGNVVPRRWSTGATAAATTGKRRLLRSLKPGRLRTRLQSAVRTTSAIRWLSTVARGRIHAGARVQSRRSSVLVSVFAWNLRRRCMKKLRMLSASLYCNAEKPTMPLKIYLLLASITIVHFKRTINISLRAARRSEVLQSRVQKWLPIFT